MVPPEIKNALHGSLKISCRYACSSGSDGFISREITKICHTIGSNGSFDRPDFLAGEEASVLAALQILKAWILSF
jgi:hypothetical protein